MSIRLKNLLLAHASERSVKREAVIAELTNERDEARAALREALGWYTVWGYALRDCKHPSCEDVARWRKAAGLGEKEGAK